MKVENSYSIDGNIVEKVFSNKSISVYRFDRDDAEAVLYFCNNQNGDVIFVQKIQADCGQNTAFISSIDFCLI